MRRLWRRADTGQVEMLKHPEDLSHRQRAGARRAHPADLITAIAHADRRADLGLIVRQILQRHQPRIIGGGADGGDDIAGDRAGIEGFRSVTRDGRQGFREGRVLQHRALGLGGAVGIEKIRRGRGKTAEPLALGERDRGGQSRGDLETSLGMFDRRLE